MQELTHEPTIFALVVQHAHEHLELLSVIPA